MSSQKIPSEAYRVRTEGTCPEWGTFYLRDWAHTERGTTYYGGELVAYTSFGTYGYHWTHCGEPFKAFLCDLEFSYFMQKASTEYKEFDFDASLAAIRRTVLEHRRATDIDKATAKDIWEALQNIEAGGDNGGHTFVGDLYAIAKLSRVTQEPYEYARERPSAQALGFWRELWPLFTGALRQELAAQQVTA